MSDTRITDPTDPTGTSDTSDTVTEPVLPLGGAADGSFWRRRQWLAAALVVAVVAAGIGGGRWWYVTSGPGAFTTVPVELVGSSASDVAATLADAGLTVVTVQAFHPTVAAGQILQVSPGEDTRIRKDATVTLTVSKGPDLRAVSLEPAGEALDAVEAALTAAGFEVVPEHVYSDTVPAGTVISATGPDGDAVTDGARLPVGTQITLQCSDGLQPVTIPAVVGMARDAAVAALAELGLAVTESQAYSADVPAGVVKAQDPAGGAAGHRLDTVAIVVSLGAEPPPPPPAGVVIPSSVVGMTKFPALDLLANKGFATKYERNTCTVEWAQCVVVKTVPAAGTRQPKGSTVTIWLANPEGTTTTTGTVPSLVGMYKYPAWDAIGSAGFSGVHHDEGCTNLLTDPGNYNLCVVQEQFPAAGTSLATGSTVEIWLKNA